MSTTDPNQADWASSLTKRLDALVGLIRDKSLRPATEFARYLIIGTFGAIIGLALVVLIIVALLHLFDTTVFRGHAFATDFLFGGIVLAAGVFLLRASAKTGRAS